MAYQMAPLMVTFSDLESHFCCLKPLFHIPLEIHRALSTTCLHINRKAVISTIFSKTNDFSRSQPVTYTVKCGNICETVPDRVGVTIDH